MDKIKTGLMQQARKRYPLIFPLGKDLAECFTLENNRLHFWFNTEDGSTHMMHANVQNGNEIPYIKTSGGTEWL